MKNKIGIFLLFICVGVFAVWPEKQNGPILPVEEGVTGIVLMGDSTIGNCKDETGIAALLEKEVQMPTYNYAIGGTCMASINTEFSNTYFFDDFSVVHLCETIANQDFLTLKVSAENLPLKKADLQKVILNLENVDLEKIDYIFIAQGLNDYMAQVLPQGEDMTSIYTYYGALTAAVKDLQQVNPNNAIVILSPTYNIYLEEVNAGTRETTYSFFEYIAICENVAKECGVEFINMYEAMGIDETNVDTYCISDHVHFNEEGRKLYTSILADFIQNHK
jgi:lysophospholipase L1-like esterase